MKNILLILFVMAGVPSVAQTEGTVVTYEKIYFWSKIIDKLTFLSEEERSRARTTWSNHDEGEKSKGILYATANQSKYVDAEEEADGGWRGHKSEYMIYRDFEKGRKIEVEEFSAKQYVIEDTLLTPSWKVMNKIRDIKGYMCMLAVSEDTVRNLKVTAWFTGDLPLSAGPEKYFGLPGLIMELDINDGEITMTASKIEKKVIDEDLKLPKKIKGKKMTTAQYNTLITTFIRDSMKAHRNPYWAIRY
jgi:GLPGLI family protein